MFAYINTSKWEPYFYFFKKAIQYLEEDCSLGDYTFFAGKEYLFVIFSLEHELVDESSKTFEIAENGDKERSIWLGSISSLVASSYFFALFFYSFEGFSPSPLNKIPPFLLLYLHFYKSSSFFLFLSKGLRWCESCVSSSHLLEVWPF